MRIIIRKTINKSRKYYDTNMRKLEVFKYLLRINKPTIEI